MDEIILTPEQNEVFNNVIESVGKNMITTLGGFAGTGKASANSALICTPFGFKQMKDIKLNDLISNPNGSTTKVIGVYPQGKQEIYKVTFSDGRFTRVTLDHLWETEIENKKNIVTTNFLFNYLNNNDNLPSVILTKPVEFINDYDENESYEIVDSIPKQLMFSPAPIRQKIINQIINIRSGGFISNHNQLLLDLQWIIRSLGGSALIKQNELIWGFNLKTITITSIEQDGFEDATCIKVDNPNELYITDDFIVTHNTSLVQKLIEKLPNWKVAAFTGKAANVLRKKKIETASTIHSAIYVPKMDYDGNIILDRNGSPIFILNPTLECDGFIIDEASMVPEDIQKDLRSFNVPILYVGDHGQLPPIGTDNYLMKNPDFKLEKIHRNAGEIAMFCEFIRRGYKPSTFSKYAKNAVKFVTKKQAETKWKDADQIICGFNKTRVDINKNIRKQLGFTSNWPEINDKIMCLKNDNQAKLFNGMQGYVKFLSAKQKNKLTFESDGIQYDIVFDPDQFNKEKVENFGKKDDPMPMDYCYAATCHKCQGDEFEVGYVLEQQCQFWEAVRWAYTAASRFKKEVYWIEQY
jgi:exodeoxyribonuclease-5